MAADDINSPVYYGARGTLRVPRLRLLTSRTRSRTTPSATLQARPSPGIRLARS